MEYEYIIVGAGPAGLQLGYYLQKAGHNYLILEASDVPGAFFRQFPRHRKLISINKTSTGYEDPEIQLRWDWNSLMDEGETKRLGTYTKRYFPDAETLVQYLADYANRHNLNVKYSARVAKISRDGNFMVTDHQGNTYTTPRLIMATGVSKPYIPPIPGIELAEQYVDVSVDPEDFRDQRVLILGKGNSGFETADNLIETTSLIHIASPNPIKLAWQTHFVGHLRAVNNNFLDTYQLKTQNAVLDATITSIRREGNELVASVRYSHARSAEGDEQEELRYDRIICCTGFRFDPSMFDSSCAPAMVLHDRFASQTSEWESTNIKDLYFVGTITQIRDYKKGQSGFIHGFRYNALALSRILNQKYHNTPWPSSTIPATPEGLRAAIIKRVNRSSALWQQFGFLCDVIVVSEKTGTAQYYEEMPMSYVHDSEYGRNDHYYTINLEFGKVTGDPFNIQRVPDPAYAQQSAFLHPVVRRYTGPSLVGEHHLLEDLSGEWMKEEVHIQPLEEFLRPLRLVGAHAHNS